MFILTTVIIAVITGCLTEVLLADYLIKRIKKDEYFSSTI